MKYNSIKLRTVLLLIVFGVACAGTCTLFLHEEYLYGIIASIIVVVLFGLAVSRLMIPYKDMRDFSEAIQYRDFSGAYSKITVPFFKEVQKVYLDLNIEKETQQQYLKKILEVVDTGILTYNIDTHEIFLTNEALRKILQIPMIKNINWIQSRNETLYNDLITLQPGENKILLLQIRNQVIKTLVNASTFQTIDGTFKLVAFQNMNATFEEVEATAWKRLLSVMTHEIMNSIAPVSSLADTLKNRIDGFKHTGAVLAGVDLEDIETGIATIKNRSDGLLMFAETYRNLYKPITLHLEPVNVFRLFGDVHRLMNPSLKQQGIDFEIITEENIPPIAMDASLMEQVLINLIVNASDAVRTKESPHIILSAGITTDGKAYMTVADNGTGIAPEQLDNIFIPFFSTKKKGSGIGLSLSRQIVKLHKGTIQLQSKPHEGSAFTIIL